MSWKYHSNSGPMENLHPHIRYNHKADILQQLNNELAPVELSSSYKDEVWVAAIHYGWFDVLRLLPQVLKQEVPYRLILDHNLFQHVPGFVFKYWVSNFHLNANSFWRYFLQSPSAPYIPHWVDFNDPYICPMDEDEMTLRDWALLFKCCLFSNRLWNLNHILNRWGVDVLLQIYDFNHTILFDWVMYYGPDRQVLMPNFLPDMDLIKMPHPHTDPESAVSNTLGRILSRSPQNIFDQTPLHLLCSYPIAAPPSIIHSLLPLVDLETQDLWNNTVMHSAMLGEQFPTIQLVLQQGANLRARNNQGLTPIHLIRNVVLAEAMNGVCFVDSFRDSWGRSLLFNTLMNYCVREETQTIHPERIEHNRTTIMQIIPHVTANQSSLVYPRAVGKSHIKTFRIFHYVLLDPEENKERFELAHHLVRELKCDLNRQDINGKTVAHYVVQHGDLEGFKFLYEHGADLKRADFQGLTPIHYLAKYNHTDLLEWFLQQNPFCTTLCHDETFWLQFIEQDHYISFERFWTQAPHFLSIEQLAYLVTRAIQHDKYNLVYLILEKSIRNHIIRHSCLAAFLESMYAADPDMVVDKLFFVFLFDLLNIFPETLDSECVTSIYNLSQNNPQTCHYLAKFIKQDYLEMEEMNDGVSCT